MPESKKIWVITSQPNSNTTDTGARSGTGQTNPWASRGATQAVQGVQVGVENLQANMSEFLGLVGDLFQQAEQNSGMKLDEVELSVEITGNGEVKLIGSGIGLEAKGAIKLKFKRS